MVFGVFLFLGCEVSQGQQIPNAVWNGTWVGTYNYTNAFCGLPNPGTITLTISVGNGVVSGSGIEYDKVCYDTNTCQITGYGTLSGSLTGAVSGSTITLTSRSNWIDSCNNAAFSVSLGGTLNGFSITGYPSLFLQKQMVENGDFETGDFTGWTLSGDTSDTFVDNGSISGITPYSGIYEAALGTSSSLGYLSQTLPTATGASYLLSLWFNNPYADPSKFLASWNGKTLFAETNLGTFNWTNIQVLVSAAVTNTVLQFGFQDNYGFLGLDDISVTPVTASGPPTISLPARFPGGQFQMTVNGVSGQNYTVQMSTNLASANWTPLLVTNSSSGTFIFSDPNATNKQRFYRVWVGP